MKQYKICYPKDEEFYIRYLVICHRKKLRGKHYSTVLEKELLKTIDSRVQNSYSKEYIFNETDVIEARIIETLQQNGKLFSIAIKFEKDGFLLFHTDNFKNKTNFTNLPTLAEAEALLALSVGKPKRERVYTSKKKVVLGLIRKKK
jgi:hypothetical protein